VSGRCARATTLIDREVESMRRTGERAQRIRGCSSLLRYRWGYSLRSVTLSIARPTPQLDQAIRRLGAGEFEGDIAWAGRRY